MNFKYRKYILDAIAAVSNITLTSEQLSTIASQIDISTKVDKVTGKSLVADTEITKLAGVAANANNYSHPANHDPSIITQDASNRFVTDAEKGTWNGKTDLATVKADTDVASAISLKHSNANDHAPGSDNQDLSGKQDVLVSATNIKTINSNSILGAGDLVVTGASPFLATLVLGADKPTGANVTPVTLGLSFNYIANKKYIIDIYALVAPTAATTGCGFLIDVSTAVTYVGTFVSHQLATSGTISGSGSIGDLGATSQGVSSGMVGTGSNFVYGGGIVITGANTGTATFFFRSETTAVTTCKTGTVIRVMEI